MSIRSKTVLMVGLFVLCLVVTPGGQSSASAYCEAPSFAVTVQYVLYGVDLLWFPGGIVIGECTTDCDGTRTCTGQTGPWPFFYFVDERITVSRCGSAVCRPQIP